MSDGIIEGRAEGVHQRIAQFPALVYGAGHVRAAVAAHTARRGEFAKEQTHPGNILSDFGMDLRVSALEIALRDQSGPAVAGAGNIDDAGVLFADEPIQMHVDKILARRRAPVA